MGTFVLLMPTNSTPQSGFCCVGAVGCQFDRAKGRLRKKPPASSQLLIMRRDSHQPERTGV